MSHEIKIPSVGESITSATLGTWHKQDGEYVESGEVILTIETDKISTELESDRSGILRHLAGEGDELEIGAPVAAIEEGDAPEGHSSSSEGSESEATEETKREEGTTPTEADGSGEEVRVTPVAKKIAEEEGLDLSRVTGTGAGGKITKSDVIGKLEDNKDAGPAATPAQVPASAKSSEAKPTTRRKMSPLRRKIATHLVNA